MLLLTLQMWRQEQRVVMEKTQKNFDVLKLIEGYRSLDICLQNKSGARHQTFSYTRYWKFWTFIFGFKYCFLMPLKS
jgi:hypothetical protein